MNLFKHTVVVAPLLLSFSLGVSADDLSLLLKDNQDASPSALINTISDNELARYRGQGFHLDITTGVVLWDEVDNGQKPQTQVSTDGGSVSITIK